MVFEDIVVVLERAFGLELKVVQDTTVFEVSSEDGGTKVKVLVQGVSERRFLLLSADLGEPPPDGGEKLYRTMLEANNLFSGTGGATLALDAATGRFRLQKYESTDELANDPEAKVVSFVETALFWARAIADFRAGLALLGTFKNWFAATNAALDTMWKTIKPVVPEGASLTVLNASTGYFKRDAEYAYEKFIFEHLAIDKAIPLAADDPETIFGMEHNPVTRFAGRGYVMSCVNTLAQIPPEKRTILFAVFDALAPLPRTVADLHLNNHGQINVEIVARVLAHLDEIATSTPIVI